jgi:hypothetical protein
MPTAFAGLYARDTAYAAQAPLVFVFSRQRCSGRAVLDPRPKLTQKQKAARRHTRRRFPCFVAWPSAC